MKLSSEAIKHLDKLPLGNSLKKYIEDKKMVHGDFITALVTNDLCRTVEHASSVNEKFIVEYAQFLILYAPKEAYGSFEKVGAWIGIKKRVHKEWMDEVRTNLVEELRIDRGEAQQLLQKYFFELTQEWSNKTNATETADRLINLKNLIDNSLKL